MKSIFAAVVPLALAACSPLEPLPSGGVLTGPANSDRIHAGAPSGPVVAYSGYRVIEPGDWRSVNDGQAGN